MAAVLTNVAFEHWGHHGGRAAYEEAKRGLFLHEDGVVPVAAVGVDDEVGAALAADLRERGSRVFGFGRDASADVRLLDCEWDLETTSAEIATAAGTEHLELSMPGEHNALNALAALALAAGLELPPETARRAIESAHAPPGRFKRVETNGPFDVVVDFAHNASGAERAIETARGARGRAPGRLIVLASIQPGYSADEKHALGAALAAADELVLTATRWKPAHPDTVPEPLVQGARDAGAEPRLIPDREDAVGAAIGLARPGDLVLLLGRGARTARLFGRDGRTLERSDLDLAAELAGTGAPVE